MSEVALASGARPSERTVGRLLLFACLASLLLASVVLPLAFAGAAPIRLGGELTPFLAILAVAAAALATFGRGAALRAAACIAVALVFAGLAISSLTNAETPPTAPAMGALVLASSLVLLMLSAIARLGETPLDRTGALAPLLFFGLILYFWELATILYAIPRILLPAPSAIWGQIVERWPTLRADFVQTVVRAAIPGLILGSAAGFFAALAVDRFQRLSGALQILGGLLSVIPILAVAPIMVLWLGFDWQSKVAVVALMTFFPMFTATGAGLQATGPTEADLMQSYAASYGQTLRFVRLPMALPYIFSALKLNVPAAMIGAMIAEFFGTPVVGLGFRIASEAGRLSFDVVWAAITLASAFSLLLYAIVVTADRLVTFWHPSHRS